MTKYVSPPDGDFETLEVKAWLEGLLGKVGKQAANQPDSTASDVATLKADFNALLDKLKANGFMEND